nr:hypothetical protein BaRGS_031549 [Batillaria attramentaria]
MIDYLELISDTTFQLLYPQFRELYKQLEARETREKEEPEKLKFLDIINYLAPGFSYAKYLAAYDVQEQKELTDKVFEVESAKAHVSWNLPLQIGFFVYQYAKLRMLQFHYDLVDKFVSRADYRLFEMDTDSLSMALSTSSFEEVVKPELRQDFYTHYNECSTQGDKSRAKGLNQ